MDRGRCGSMIKYTIVGKKMVSFSSKKKVPFSKKGKKNWWLWPVCICFSFFVSRKKLERRTPPIQSWESIKYRIKMNKNFR